MSFALILAVLLDHWLGEPQKHQQTSDTLKSQSERLVVLLAKYGLKVTGQTDLYLWIKMEKAQEIYTLLAQQGVLTRLFQKPASLRFGLLSNEQQWRQLEECVAKL